MKNGKCSKCGIEGSRLTITLEKHETLCTGPDTNGMSASRVRQASKYLSRGNTLGRKSKS